MLQKLKELGYEVWPHLPYSPDLLSTDYHFYQYTAYRPASGNYPYYEPAKEMPDGGPKLAPAEGVEKTSSVKTVSRAIKARGEEPKTAD